MPSCFEKCSVHLYADDTVIYYSDKDPCNIENVLNIELHKLYSWMNCNKLKINCTKTVSMLIGTKYMLNRNSRLNLKINDNDIVQVDKFKYLGIFIDCELKWNVHTDELCKKVGKMISFLGRLRNYVNETGLKLVYNAAIMQHFDYGDVLWHSGTKSQVDMLQKIQNRAGRIILKYKLSEHKPISEIHNILNWEMLENRQVRHSYTLMYKIFHDLAPVYLKERFIVKTTNYALRSTNLVLPKPKTQNSRLPSNWCNDYHTLGCKLSPEYSRMVKPDAQIQSLV